jgi:23S rRNA pseudouridine1911/1915/1917 synthase
VPKIDFVVAAPAANEERATLSALLRAHGKLTWSRAQALCERGKVAVDDQIVLDPARRIRPGARVDVDERRGAPRPQTVPVVFEDAYVIVIDKPTGMSSVPFEKRETGTAMDAIRDAWRADGRRATDTPLLVVHRIDKDTSGLLAFAKTKEAERGLQALFRAHDVERTYLCVAHGAVTDLRIESKLVTDRGDGLRGSARTPGQGKRAVTHVRLLEALPDTSLLEVKLETGKTHQIRIHLAESGHPLVGERVYIRDYSRRGVEPIEVTRLLLHAATLGFKHPITGASISLSASLPPSFERQLKALRKRPPLAPRIRASTTKARPRPRR